MKTNKCAFANQALRSLEKVADSRGFMQLYETDKYLYVPLQGSP